jgi:elongation factor P
MLSISDIKTGKNIVLNGEPCAVIFCEHSKMGRAGAVLRTKLRNLISGAVLEKTFQGADKLEEAEITKSKAQYLYKEEDNYIFMDSQSYDQFFLPRETLGGSARYLIEGTEVVVLNFNNNPVSIELPVKMKLKVAEAPPGIKGDTASGGGKLVKLETGMEITAPLFIKEGDEIIVNTEKGEYVSRA